MNYIKIHNTIIDRAKLRATTEYTEIHHIIPRSMGGTDDASNLVNLTPEEHYIVHQLLVKIYPDNKDLVFAANMMCVNRSSNKLYGWLRRKMSQRMKEHNPNAGGDSRRKFNKKHGSPNKGFTHSEESKKLFAEKKLGNKNPRYGKPGTMRTTTYLLNPQSKEVEYTFDTLEEAEKYIGVNHTTVWYNRSRNRPHKGYFWCVGDNELQKQRETI